MTAPLRILQGVFGFDAFRPGQEAPIGALLAGRHVLTVMPTGSGKSLCFQVPALVLDGLTVVVSPLVALMQDQVAAPAGRDPRPLTGCQAPDLAPAPDTAATPP